MDIVQNFHSYLFSQKNPPSKITVKNYLADVRKFLNWYVQTFGIPFEPSRLDSETVKRYKDYLSSGSVNSLPAARSSKRYLSSLRRFSSFLRDTGAIASNPFELVNEAITFLDPFYFKEFKNYLYTEHASKLTIKNYVADISQFIDWLKKVIPEGYSEGTSTLLTRIDNSSLGEYKMRLLNEAKLSPVSINRKLSSLRRYSRWLADRGILTQYIEIERIPDPAPAAAIIPELPLLALQGLAEEKANKNNYTYSKFPPFRLLQKTSRIISLGTDLLFFNPIALSAEHIHYALWKKGKKAIFAPVSAILESSSYIPEGVSIKTIIPKASSIIPPRSASPKVVLEKISRFNPQINPETVHNFTKALYAPLDISTTHMPFKQKFWHYLRYRRPGWYKRYHTYTFVTYLHFGIMMIAAVIAGAALFQAWSGNTMKATEAVLSAQDTSPPRVITFKGRLLDSTNTPITAETPLRFAIYNDPVATGAAMVWEENQDIKPDQNGNFTASLGLISRLNQSMFTDNPNLYIGIKVGDNPELTPRQEIPTTNYAAESQTVEGLKPITDSPDLDKNVLLALDSLGNLTIGGGGHTFQTTGGQFKISGTTLSLTTNPGSNGNIQIAPDGSGIIDLERPLQNISNYSSSGGVPGAVEVDDVLSILATTSSQSALFVNQNGAGDIISGLASGTDKFRIDHEGNEYLSGNLVLDGDTINTTSSSFDIGSSNVNDLTIGTNASLISLGGSSGITSIRNSLSVQGTASFAGAATAYGLFTANGGLTIPAGQYMTLPNFPNGALPYFNSSNQLSQDSSYYFWDDTGKSLNITGSICIEAVSSICPEGAGTIYAANTSVQAADLAENYISSQNLQPGDVVSAEDLGNSMAIIASTKPYQSDVIGIVSTHPGVTLNSGAETDSGHPYIFPLALQGRVPVKVSSINGDIQPGDELTSSSIPGVAMKATDSGQVIGKALEAYSDSNTNAIGEITVFVNLTYQTNPATITADGNLAAASMSGELVNSAQTNSNPVNTIANSIATIAGTISLGMVQAQSITTQSLQVATDNIMIGGQTVQDYIATNVQQIINQDSENKNAQETQPSQIINPIASNSAEKTYQSISPTPTVTPVSRLEINVDQSASSSPTFPIYNSIASQSASASNAATVNDSLPVDATGSALPNEENTEPYTLPQPVSTLTPPSGQYLPLASDSGQLSYVPNFKTNFATVNEGLIVLGPTSLNDLAVSNTISINNNLKISQNSIDTIASDLNIEPLRQGNILFMDGLVSIDTRGNLSVNGNATFAENVSVNGQLAAGIIAPIPNQDLAINLPNKSNNSGSSLLITNATGSAVVQINQAGDLTSSGGAQFNSITAGGFSIIRGAQADTSMTETVANGSAGTGVITAYETERTIITPYVTDHSLIYITPTSATGGLTPYLARQTVEDPQSGTNGSFTVAIPNQITKDITFNWWIVN
jgi:site-specific recombinase XerD